MFYESIANIISMWIINISYGEAMTETKHAVTEQSLSAFVSNLAIVRTAGLVEESIATKNTVWLQLAKRLYLIKYSKYYKSDNTKSFAVFCKTHKIGRTTGFKYVKIYRVLVITNDIAEEELQDISVARAYILTQVKQKSELLRILKLAPSLKIRDLSSLVKSQKCTIEQQNITE